MEGTRGDNNMAAGGLSNYYLYTVGNMEETDLNPVKCLVSLLGDTQNHKRA